MPMLLHDALEDGGVRDIDSWWCRLDESSQSGLIDLWDSCVSRMAIHPSDIECEFEMRVVATATDPDSDTFEGFWNHDFYDYLVNHESYYFEEQKFHVCTSQPEARRAIESGLIPSDHVCPLDSTSCPMLEALRRSGGRSLRLGITFVPKTT